jgi:hypothetical protein
MKNAARGLLHPVPQRRFRREDIPDTLDSLKFHLVEKPKTTLLSFRGVRDEESAFSLEVGGRTFRSDIAAQS